MDNQIEMVYEYVPLNKLLKKGDKVLIQHEGQEVEAEFLGRSMDGMIHLNNERYGELLCRTNWFNQSAKAADREMIANRFLQTVNT